MRATLSSLLRLVVDCEGRFLEHILLPCHSIHFLQVYTADACQVNLDKREKTCWTHTTFSLVGTSISSSTFSLLQSRYRNDVTTTATAAAAAAAHFSGNIRRKKQPEFIRAALPTQFAALPSKCSR